ncbi:cilia- and flagella-associated protein 57-like [Eupeodes corollae]|uniref:cilia- and flagella-associated protein 57-like n=1 Tax=Eupeodes corollae TaxID=290404 RepID=UPI002491F79E|nr:cilia- and flagella-associated protein 57-like [Eupeodes corollae]
MDESTSIESNTSLPVTIEPKHVHGIRSEVIGNIHFNSNEEVIYPVEAVLAFHDYVKDKQRFLKFPVNTTPTIITLSPTKLSLAVVEVRKYEQRESQITIVIYDINTFKKKQSFQLPAEFRQKSITQMSYTCDSKAIVVLTEYPDEMLYMFFFDKLGTVVEGRAGNVNRRGMASHISCNPHNPDLVVVCGEGLIKLMMKSENSFTYCGDINPNLYATSVAWTSEETFIVGTKQGMLIIYSNAVKLKTYRAMDVENFDITTKPDFENQLLVQEASTVADPMAKSQAVVCINVFSMGVAFAIFNRVFVFEKPSKGKYGRKTILEIPMENYPEDLYQITNMAINSKQDTVLVTTLHNQIYVGILIVPQSYKTQRIKFQTLGELIHIDEIRDICMCSWRPIIITSSKDKTIRIWNYHTGKTELVKTFEVEVTVLELYASGQYAAVGFIDKVKIMQIFMEDMNLLKIYKFPKSKDIKFSYSGHLMATAYENNIAITSVFTLDTLRIMKGHSGSVLTLAWARNDKSVISGGSDGAVYQWDIETGARLQEVIQPGLEFYSLCVPNDPECFYAASNTGIIMEIKNSKILREVKMPSNSPLQDIGLTRSDLVMFAATKGGHLYNVHMPFSDPDGGGTLTKFPFFDSAITKLRFSHDGTMLITSSASGTLVIWELQNIKDKVAPIDKDLLKSQEVLIPRQELEDKKKRIKMLDTRLQRQADEFYKKQSQNQASEQQIIDETIKDYCISVREIELKNKKGVEAHAIEVSKLKTQVDEIQAEHKLNMARISAQYTHRIELEHGQFLELRSGMITIRDTYEKRLKDSEQLLRETVAALELDFKKQYEDRQEVYRGIIKKMDDKKIEFAEFCRKVEVENDRKMIDSQIEYETKVRSARNETDKLKARANVYQSKYDNVKQNCENLLEQVENMKDQHFKAKDLIVELTNRISDLREDLVVREATMGQKDKQADDMVLKNEEMEKFREVLGHKLNELRKKVGPREMIIVEKRKQIADSEQELVGVQQSNIELNLQLKDLNDRCRSVNVELKQERKQAELSKLALTQIRTEIYQLSQKIDNPDELKKGIQSMFLKYSDDDYLKKFAILDASQTTELLNQRLYIEKIMEIFRQKMEQESYQSKTMKKLVFEHKVLQEQLAKCRNKNLANEIKNLKVLVDIFKKIKKLEESGDGLVKVENIKFYFDEKIKGLKADIKNMIEKNHKCKKNIDMKRMMLNKTDL